MTVEQFWEQHLSNMALSKDRLLADRDLRYMLANARAEGMRGAAIVVEKWATRYPADIFGEPPNGGHGASVDSCSARAIRSVMPLVAFEILQKADEVEGE